MPRLRLIVTGLLLCRAARTQDSGLSDLRAALEALRPHAQEHRETRGATSALTAIKRGLRDWAEARLVAFGQNGDEDSLNRQFQEAFASAGLLCPDGCPLNALGYVDAVRVRRQAEFLTVETSVGIACGYDDSTYVYEWRAGAWRRIFETEQDNYTKTGYLPQTIYAVQVSAPDRSGGRLVLSLGSRPGCSNAFQPLYYRLWRIGPGGSQSKVLLDASETAYIGAYPPVRAILSPAELRLEFTAGGTGYGEGHQAERHFEVNGTGVRQVEPIAPTPRDFVEEWLAAPWKQVAQWSESASLEAAHNRLHRDDAMGDFPDRQYAAPRTPKSGRSGSGCMASTARPSTWSAGGSRITSLLRRSRITLCAPHPNSTNSIPARARPARRVFRPKPPVFCQSASRESPASRSKDTRPPVLWKAEAPAQES